MATFKLTEATLATRCTPPGDAAQAYYWDTEQRGFGVIVGRTGRKTFVVRGRANGRLVKATIGAAGTPRDSDGHTWTVRLARIEAMKLLGAIASGLTAEAEAHAQVDSRARDFHGVSLAQ